jgi:thiol-disulfide isomerase/thioredoxin
MMSGGLGMNAYIKGGIAAVVVAVAIFAWYKANEGSLPVNQSPAEFLQIKKMETVGVPDFTLERMDGTLLKLSDLKGKVVVVNFWASWCNPCVEEFPSLVKLAEKGKGKVVVVAVSTDEQRKDIEPFLKLFSLPKPGFEIVWDKDHKIMNEYAVGKIPESYIVKPDFRLARKILGVENWDSDDALMFFDMIFTGKLPGSGHGN